MNFFIVIMINMDIELIVAHVTRKTLRRRKYIRGVHGHNWENQVNHGFISMNSGIKIKKNWFWTKSGIVTCDIL